VCWPLHCFADFVCEDGNELEGIAMKETEKEYFKEALACRHLPLKTLSETQCYDAHLDSQWLQGRLLAGCIHHNVFLPGLLECYEFA
jgi:hypothetical protein